MKKFTTAFCLMAMISGSLSAENQWCINSDQEWQEAKSQSSEMKFEKGFAKPQAKQSQFSSIIKTFDEKQKLANIQIKQSAIWDNWEQIDDITHITKLVLHAGVNIKFFIFLFSFILSF